MYDLLLLLLLVLVTLASVLENRRSNTGREEILIRMHKEMAKMQQHLDTFLATSKEDQECLKHLLLSSGRRRRYEETYTEETCTEDLPNGKGNHRGAASPSSPASPTALQATTRLVELGKEYIHTVLAPTELQGVNPRHRRSKTPTRASPASSISSFRMPQLQQQQPSMGRAGSPAESSSNRLLIVERMRECVAQGASVTVKDRWSLAASAPVPFLSFCVLQGLTEVVEVLLESPQPIDFTATNDNGDTALHWICCDAEHKSGEQVRALLECVLDRVAQRRAHVAQQQAEEGGGGGGRQKGRGKSKGLEDAIDFSQRSRSGHEAISWAALYGHLSTWWSVVKKKDVSYYLLGESAAPLSADLPLQLVFPLTPMELQGGNKSHGSAPQQNAFFPRDGKIHITFAVRRADWDQISPADQQRFIRGVYIQLVYSVCVYGQEEFISDEKTRKHKRTSRNARDRGRTFFFLFVVVLTYELYIIIIIIIIISSGQICSTVTAALGEILRIFVIIIIIIIIISVYSLLLLLLLFNWHPSGVPLGQCTRKASDSSIKSINDKYSERNKARPYRDGFTSFYCMRGERDNKK
eukprot:gene12363-8490_t